MKLGPNHTGELQLSWKKKRLKRLKYYNPCRILAPALAEMKSLEKLYLNNTNMGDEGCRYLAPALAELKGLNTLSLCQNIIGEIKIK